MQHLTAPPDLRRCRRATGRPSPGPWPRRRTAVPELHRLRPRPLTRPARRRSRPPPERRGDRPETMADTLESFRSTPGPAGGRSPPCRPAGSTPTGSPPGAVSNLGMTVARTLGGARPVPGRGRRPRGTSAWPRLLAAARLPVPRPVRPASNRPSCVRFLYVDTDAEAVAAAAGRWSRARRFAPDEVVLASARCPPVSHYRRIGRRTGCGETGRAGELYSVPPSRVTGRAARPARHSPATSMRLGSGGPGRVRARRPPSTRSTRRSTGRPGARDRPRVYVVASAVRRVRAGCPTSAPRTAGCSGDAAERRGHVVGLVRGPISQCRRRPTGECRPGPGGAARRARPDLHGLRGARPGAGRPTGRGRAAGRSGGVACSTSGRRAVTAAHLLFAEAFTRSDQAAVTRTGPPPPDSPYAVGQGSAGCLAAGPGLLVGRGGPPGPRHPRRVDGPVGRRHDRRGGLGGFERGVGGPPARPGTGLGPGSCSGPPRSSPGRSTR